MKKFSYTIQDMEGIHARPAGLLVNEVKKYENCTIMLYKKSKSGDAKRLLQVMGLGVKCGDTIEVTVEGDGEENVVSSIKEFFQTNL
jgi:phosphocarrier protein HPr